MTTENNDLNQTADSLKYVIAQKYFVELKNGPLWKIDLKYATVDNFMNENMYHEFNRAFLHEHAATQLIRAAEYLQIHKPGYRFLIYDALRPRSVQWKMWNKVKNTDHQQYIANPETGSNHNFGMAVDLTVIDDQEQVLDMGTGFDEFSEVSQPRYEDKFISDGKLTAHHKENRGILKHAMEAAGFKQLSTEWWHFDARPKAEIRANYQIVE